MLPAPQRSLMIIVPAYNEAGAVGLVVKAIHDAAPDVPVVVIDDCSLDSTIGVAESALPVFMNT